jgi:hypothetical protein
MFKLASFFWGDCASGKHNHKFLDVVTAKLFFFICSFYDQVSVACPFSCSLSVLVVGAKVSSHLVCGCVQLGGCKSSS